MQTIKTTANTEVSHSVQTIQTTANTEVSHSVQTIKTTANTEVSYLVQISDVEVVVCKDERVREHGQEGEHWDGQQCTSQFAGLLLLVSP